MIFPSTFICTTRFRAVQGMPNWRGATYGEILDGALTLLENCPARCDRSCESCLQHYRNQHLKERLDRKLGAELLRYALSGAAPGEASPPDPGPSARWTPLPSRTGWFCVSGRCSAQPGPCSPTCQQGRKASRRRGSVGIARRKLAGPFDGIVSSAPRGPIGKGSSTNMFSNEIFPDEHQLIRGMF